MINPERGKVNSCRAVFLCGSMSDPTPPRHVGHKVQSSACGGVLLCWVTSAGFGSAEQRMPVQSSVCSALGQRETRA